MFPKRGLSFFDEMTTLSCQLLQSMILTTDSLGDSWAPGVDAQIGVRTGYSAVEIGWWSLFANSDDATAISTGGDLFSIINFMELDIDFNGSQLHRLEAESELHTFELNQRHLLSGWNSGRLSFAYMWGLRYTQVSDELRFLADIDSTVLSDPNGDVSYDVAVDKRMFGPQRGGSIYWQIRDRMAAYLDAKVGVFYNHIDQS